MKLYIKMKNTFLFISVILLLSSLYFLLIKHIYELGYFLLGLFATTLIITIQSAMSAQVEEGRLLVGKLKRMRDLCYKFSFFNTFSVDHFSYDFEDEFHIYSDRLKGIFELNGELGNLADLNDKTMVKLQKITDEFVKLQLDLHFILTRFDDQTDKMKVIYFMEFYKIIKEFDFEKMAKTISSLGWEIDSKEFYRSKFSEKVADKIRHYEYQESIDIYNERLEQNHKVEYKALKKKFDLGLKNQ